MPNNLSLLMIEMLTVIVVDIFVVRFQICSCRVVEPARTDALQVGGVSH